MGPQSKEVTTTIVAELVADALDVPVEELPSLSRTIDLDALNALVTPAGNESPVDLAVSFTYAGLRIHVYSGNTVYVQPIRDRPSGDLHPRSVS